MNNLRDIDKQNIWHPFTPLIGAPEPVLITKAEGVYLHTDDGKKIIDAVSSWWVNIHGHSHPTIAKALFEQASQLEHVIFAGFTHKPAIELSEKLLSILPQNQSKIFFSDNGSTAVEVALKMSFQYWYNKGKPKTTVIAIKGAYHGDTFGSMSVADRNIFTDPFSPFLFDCKFLDFPDGTNDDKVVASFKKLIDEGGVSTFIFEPLVQGAAGMRIYNAETLDQLIAYAQNNEVVCVADEVFTGFYRTGKAFACDYLNNKPDIIAISKGITGGTMPLGVTACSQNIVDGFQSSELAKTFFHGHSYTANPLACACALASFDLLMKDECQEKIRTISYLQKKFCKIISDHPKLKSARCLGTLLALELNTDSVSSYTNEIRKKIYSFFLQRGILLRPLGNVIYVLPPYVISDSELGQVHDAISTFLNE